MAKLGNEQNLTPVRTKEEARERGRNGGKKSGIVRREKKLMSQIYADFLIKEHKIELFDYNTDGTIKEVKTEKMTGEKLMAFAMRKVLTTAESSSVSLMKEVREATEGSKVDLTTDGEPITGITIAYEKPKK